MSQNLVIVIKSLVFTLVAIVALELLLSFARGLGLHLLADSLVGNVLLEATIFGVQIGILNKYSQGKRLESIGLRRKRNGVRHALVGSFIGLAGIVLIYITVFASKIGVFEGFGFQYHHATVVLLFIISLFIRAFFAGVCEEVFFRGVLLQYLAKYKGKTFGLIVSSIIFSMFHCTRYNDLYQLSSVLLLH
ncbi:CPBP family intramembrane glutamic endopeptidase [Paenibacillus puldeungensis]